MSRENTSSDGLVLTLTIIFIVLKCVNVIQWSWFWVLSPLWISLGFGVIIFLVFGLVMLLAGMSGRRKTEIRRTKRINRAPESPKLKRISREMPVSVIETEPVGRLIEPEYKVHGWMEEN